MAGLVSPKLVRFTFFANDQQTDWRNWASEGAGYSLSATIYIIPSSFGYFSPAGWTALDVAVEKNRGKIENTEIKWF